MRTMIDRVRELADKLRLPVEDSIQQYTDGDLTENDHATLLTTDEVPWQEFVASVRKNPFYGYRMQHARNGIYFDEMTYSTVDFPFEVHYTLSIRTSETGRADAITCVLDGIACHSRDNGKSTVVYSFAAAKEWLSSQREQTDIEKESTIL